VPLFTFPILLDEPDYATLRHYDIIATPMVFLIESKDVRLLRRCPRPLLAAAEAGNGRCIRVLRPGSRPGCELVR
jgi:hypothetical protein